MTSISQEAKLGSDCNQKTADIFPALQTLHEAKFYYQPQNSRLLVIERRELKLNTPEPIKNHFTFTFLYLKTIITHILKKLHQRRILLLHKIETYNTLKAIQVLTIH